MTEATDRPAGVTNELEGVLVAATEAVTDDMVGRVADSAARVVELLDRVNRSGVAEALPAVSAMVNNGDLERLARIARVLGAAEDAVTDDMIGRLAETLGDGVALLDSVNRSGISKALPLLTRMVENGDLERIAQLARLLGAMEDAVTDDMVGRFADLAGDSVTVLDRLNRSGVGKLIDVLDRLNNLGALDKMAERLPALVANLELAEKLLGCLGEAAQEVKTAPPSRAGLMRLLRIARDPQNQRSIEFALALSRRISRQFD